jgi:hypothetical protein
MRKPDTFDFADFIAEQISVPSGDRRGDIRAIVASDTEDTVIAQVNHLDWTREVKFEIKVRLVSEPDSE